jgi:hypothetical protein
MQKRLHNLNVGDRLVRHKGIVMHHGIYVGCHNGQHLVAENNLPHGVRYVPYHQFLNGRPLARVEPFRGTEYQRNQIIPFINSKLGTSYDLTRYNCEHFANEVQTGRVFSKQVQTAGLLGLMAAVVLVASNEA